MNNSLSSLTLEGHISRIKSYNTITLVSKQPLKAYLLWQSQNSGSAVSLIIAWLRCLDVLGAGYWLQERHVTALSPGDIFAHHLWDIIPDYVLLIGRNLEGDINCETCKVDISSLVLECSIQRSHQDCCRERWKVVESVARSPKTLKSRWSKHGPPWLSIVETRPHLI